MSALAIGDGAGLCRRSFEGRHAPQMYLRRFLLDQQLRTRCDGKRDSSTAFARGWLRAPEGNGEVEHALSARQSPEVILFRPGPRAADLPGREWSSSG
jgi:hypothetical protein